MDKQMRIRVNDDGFVSVYVLKPSIKRASQYVKYYKVLWNENRVKRGLGILLHWCKLFLFNFLFEDDWDI